MLRTHTCGELRAEHSSLEVTLAGWVHRRRDHGTVLFIDLRDRYGSTQRERMQQILALRHRAVKFIRDFLDARGFYEIETPMLMKSTPEGARDYLVPSRLHPGTCYALPQSPQQLKQFLMIAGFDTYFQIARCMRDEDLRADRQPEFTQLDLEMGFVEQDDVLEVVESLLVALVPAVTPHKRLPSPFPRLTYAEAMARFGTHKPDLRYGLELVDISDLVADSGFDVFVNALGPRGRSKVCVHLAALHTRAGSCMSCRRLPGPAAPGVRYSLPSLRRDSPAPPSPGLWAPSSLP